MVKASVPTMILFCLKIRGDVVDLYKRQTFRPSSQKGVQNEQLLKLCQLAESARSYCRREEFGDTIVCDSRTALGSGFTFSATVGHICSSTAQTAVKTTRKRRRCLLQCAYLFHGNHILFCIDNA